MRSVNCNRWGKPQPIVSEQIYRQGAEKRQVHQELKAVRLTSYKDRLPHLIGASHGRKIFLALSKTVNTYNPRAEQVLDQLARAVIGAAIEVHRHLGAGLQEPLYTPALQIELSLRSIPFETEVILPVSYK